MSVRVIHGDCRTALLDLPSESVHCCVTSPPYYGLRDYGVDGQIGLEDTPDAYVAEMVAVFREVRRVLRSDGTLWLNIGDSYCSIGHKKSHSGFGTTGLAGGKAQEHHPLRRENNAASIGCKHKDLIGIPWMLAFALRADGWWLRQDIIWSKPNPMPESVTDRCTKAHEYLFMLSKSARYYYDADAIKEPASPNTHARISQDLAAQVGSFRANGGNKTNGPMRAVIAGSTRKIAEAGSGIANNRSYEARALKVEARNKRSVWEIATQPFSEAHFATFPPALIEPCILAGCPKGGTVLDPFGGAGTTGLVADRLERSAVLIELNPAYAAMARNRIADDAPLFAQVGD